MESELGLDDAQGQLAQFSGTSRRTLLTDHGENGDSRKKSSSCFYRAILFVQGDHLEKDIRHDRFGVDVNRVRSFSCRLR